MMERILRGMTVASGVAVARASWREGIALERGVQLLATSDLRRRVFVGSEMVNLTARARLSFARGRREQSRLPHHCPIFCCRAVLRTLRRSLALSLELTRGGVILLGGGGGKDRIRSGQAALRLGRTRLWKGDLNDAVRVERDKVKSSRYFGRASVRINSDTQSGSCSTDRQETGGQRSAGKCGGTSGGTGRQGQLCLGGCVVRNVVLRRVILLVSLSSAGYCAGRNGRVSIQY
ncbi:hypothetical protein Tco_1343948 [Tanacetum coccineum]